MDQQNPQYTSQQAMPPKPVAPTPAPKKKDPVGELIELQKQNQELLQTIASNSELQLAAVKSQGRQKIYGALLKYALYAGIMYYSIILTPKLIETMMAQITSQVTEVVDESVNNLDMDNVKEALSQFGK